ncbi:MAG: hypothetical protein ACEPOV_00595 [Hyphomicrobiales bacterium]
MKNSKFKQNENSANNVNCIALPILYKTVPNPLKDMCDINYYIKISNNQCRNHKETLKKVNNFINIPIPVIESCLNGFFYIVAQELQKGNSIHTNWIYSHVSARGTVDSIDEVFDPKHNAEHEIFPNVQFTKSLKTEIQENIEPLNKTDYSSPVPEIQRVFDEFSKAENILMKGGITVIKGSSFRLKKDESIQIILLDTDGNSHEMDKVNFDSDNYIRFCVDKSLPIGDYKLMLIKNTNNETPAIRFGNDVTVKE